MPKLIAIVEDEQAIAENYSDALKRQGYDTRIYNSRSQAQAAFDAKLPDLAIIDIGLKDDVEGGFELCRNLRAASAELPIVFLTARDSELDVISGLRLGADDYLTKDISQAHMLARITALFRRINAIQHPSENNELMQRGKLSINQQCMSVRWLNTDIILTVTEYWIVFALAQHPGHVKNRQQLMDSANVVLDDNTITSHIKRIRKKFLAVDAHFNKIETAYGIGYRWLAETI